MVVEDLHWLDPSSLELQQLLAEQGAIAPLMLLYTARPEFRQPWPLHSHHTQVTLNRPSVRDVEKMVAQVAARHPLLRETFDAVIERTSGVPLFVEELTRALLESGESRPEAHAIPETLHDSLMARLDRLGTAKEVAQLGAVIGAEFTYELLEAVSSTTKSELQAALAKLADAELIYSRGIPPEAAYQFKHAFIKDAAYDALLKSQRRELHRFVAQAIAQKFTRLKETQPEVLARHWAEADEAELAVVQWSTAGKAAQARNAFHEARESYQRALAQLSVLPESPERDARELELRQRLFAMLLVTLDWAAPEVVASAERAAKLAEKSGNYKWLRRTMLQRTGIAYVSGAFSVAAALAGQAYEYALREGSPTTLAHVHHLHIVIDYYRGDLVGVEKHLAAGFHFFDDPVFRRDPAATFIDVFGTAAYSACISGRVNLSRERLATAAAAINAASPFDLPYSQTHAAVVHPLIRENERAESLATRALELCEKHKIPSLAATLRCILGRAWVELGRASNGVEMIRQGTSGMLDSGSRLGITCRMTWLAVAQHRAGVYGEALGTGEQALEINPEELVYRPEALRVRGELRFEKGQAELAEADFRDAKRSRRGFASV